MIQPIDLNDQDAVGRAFTRTVVYYANRRLDSAQGLVGKLVYYRPSANSHAVAAVVLDAEEGTGALEGITFASLLPVEGVRAGDRRTSRLDVDVEAVAALDILDRTQAHAVGSRWEATYGQRLPRAARVQAGLEEKPLDRDDLRRLLANFAAEVEMDIDAEREDWGTGTERQFGRIAARLGL